jgi:ribosomal protein S18 acetylase RimI-like enzyme
MREFSVIALGATGTWDRDVEALLWQTFGGGGFTEPERAATAFLAANVRARGEVLVAVSNRENLLGMVIVVPPESAARRFALGDAAEMHLLGVAPQARGRGVGGALVERAIRVARGRGAGRLVLWTQPAMQAAQRLYQRFGFARVPELDFSRGDRSFLVYARDLRATVNSGRGRGIRTPR